MIKRELYRTKSIPVFQNKMFPTEAEALACPKSEVVLVEDSQTGLVSNGAFNKQLLEYGSDYQNEQAGSVVFHHHINSVSEIIHRHFKGYKLVEVGCGKGCFLDKLQELGYDITGVDPAYEGSKTNIVKAYFDRSLGLSADGIILRHVLEHIENPIAFLSAIKDANGGKGKIYIEVPCFNWICKHRAWFDILYEHVNYFRLNDLHRMFGTVYESGYFFGSQYLFLVADLSSLKMPIFDPSDAVDFPKNFNASFEKITSYLKTSKNKAIWGAASKGMILAFHLKEAGIPVDMIIDINPAKQGKHLAGSGLRVSSPEEALHFLPDSADVLVMNSNYFEEIVTISNNRFRYIKVDNYEI